jgi:hypothetical protein
MMQGKNQITGDRETFAGKKAKCAGMCAARRNGGVRHGAEHEMTQRAMITATCGLGLLAPSAIAESFSVAHKIGLLVRSLRG